MARYRPGGATAHPAQCALDPPGTQCYGVGPAIDQEDGPKGLRRPQRSRAHPRERAAPFRPFQLGRRQRFSQDNVRMRRQDRSWLLAHLEWRRSGDL